MNTLTRYMFHDHWGRAHADHEKQARKAARRG